MGKGATTNQDVDLDQAEFPPWEETKARVDNEMQGRSGIENDLQQRVAKITTDPHEIDDAVDSVQMLVLDTYGIIRSQVCDQVELFAESFFKLPMLRRLEEDMAEIQLSDEDKAHYKARRSELQDRLNKCNVSLEEVNWCIKRLKDFQLQCSTRFTSIG